MGSAIASRLSGAGFPVSGWSRSGIPADKAETLTIDPLLDIASLMASCDIVILSLSDDAAVTAVLDEMCRYSLTGKLIVDCSTVSPDILRGRIGMIQAAGGAALDAPISGWPDMVANGKAGLYIGGDMQHVTRFMPVAEVLSNRIHHVGDLGDGAAMKIVNNMMLGGYWQCLKEAMQVGKRAGLSAGTMLQILTGSPAANGTLAAKSPVIQGQSDAVSFTVEGITKDLALFVETARRSGVDVPAITAALASFNAYGDAGNSAADFATMVRDALEEV